MNATSLLLVQLTLILGLARLLAWLLDRLGQPPVIGEMIAGFLLGPIAFGALAPELHRWLFAPEHLPALNGISQIGIALFMFIIGAELRAPQGARASLLAATWVGVLALAVPFALGLGLAPLLHAEHAPNGVGFWPFALFVAISLGVTAFPVLARILKDRDLTRGTVGRLALAAAAIADALAWILLALVVALVGARGWEGFLRALLGLGAIAAIGFGLLRPLIARWLARHAGDGRPNGGVLGLLLVGVCAMAAATEWLGLHAVFGAFLFGLCLPRDDRLLEVLIERIEHVAVLALMPVFFALAGLNTSADAFAAAALPTLALILAIAIIGKLLGGGFGARIAGLSWRDAFAIGALMNTRGLMELVVLKIGLDAGVIGREIFTMLMVMAIVTTLMTSPMLSAYLRGGKSLPSSNETARRSG